MFVNVPKILTVYADSFGEIWAKVFSQSAQSSNQQSSKYSLKSHNK